MDLTKHLLSHYRTDDLLVACKQLVEDAFPECVGCETARDVVSLARRAGIAVRIEKEERFDGRFESDSSGSSTITVSSLGSRARMRFTLAHELSHWLLRRGSLRHDAPAFRGVVNSDRSSWEEERLADLLAAELLMPAQFVGAELSVNRLNMATVRKFQRRFEVSFRAALRRIADVAGIHFLYINLVPHRFKQMESYAEIDDAFEVSPMRGLCRDREGARLVRKYSFLEIARSRRSRIGVILTSRRFLEEFEVNFNQRPIPNCDLLATVGGGARRDPTL